MAQTRLQRAQAGSFILRDAGGQPIQGFAPDPGLSTFSALANGETVSINVDKTMALRFTEETDQKLDIYFSATNYTNGVKYMSAGDTYIIWTDVDEIIFGNSTGAAATVYIEGM